MVYKAEDTVLGRFVALKFLPDELSGNRHSIERFRREARTASALNHPNICTIYDFGEHGERQFLVMELLEGQTLRNRIVERRIKTKQLVEWGIQVADALDAAHAKGIVHRDTKPENILITERGQAKVMDFGLAKLLRRADDSTLTQDVTESLAMAGTLPYMAPEQLLGEQVDARTDVYALGAILYEMATGQRPFNAKAASALAADILHKAPVPPRQLNTELPGKLEEIILKCLEKDPENRYQSAREAAVDLRRVAASAAPMVTSGGVNRSWRKVGRQAVYGITGLALLALLFAALNASGWLGHLLGRGGSPRIESIAVLPLANLSGDAQQEYFADGMTEALITELAQISALKVISRTSAMQYKGAKEPLPQIAKELGVDAIVEGTVQRSGDKVGITVELIYAPTDRHLWAEAYERDLRDVLSLQQDMARSIAGEIETKLTPQEQDRLARTRTVDPEAYQLYLQGLFFLNKRTDEGLNRAVEYFEQAIGKDPNSALAYSGLADAYALRGSFLYTDLPPTEAMPKGRAAALKALQMDDARSESHASLAYIELIYDWDWAKSEQDFKQAIQLNPNYAQAHHWYAIYLASRGRHEESIAEIKKSQELDPLSLINNTNVGWMLYYARRYDEAAEQLRRVLELDQNFFVAHWELGLAYEQKGMHPEAQTEFEKASALSRGNPVVEAALAHSYARAGKRDKALRILAQLKMKEPAERGYLAFQIAEIYAGLQQKEEALNWLGKAYAERSAWMAYIKVEPELDVLRDEPRFQELLRRVGVPNSSPSEN